MGGDDPGDQLPTVSESRSRWSELRAVAIGPDSYGLVFLLLIGDYVLLTSGWKGSVALIVSAVWLGATVLLAFHTSRVPDRVMNVVRIAVAVVVLGALAAGLAGGDQAAGAVLLVMSALVVASPIAIGWRVAHHATVTAQTILGALSIYVLIGLIFANADYGFQLATGSSFFAQSGHHGPADFGYFSFITMATVGYGDLTPRTGLPRSFAVLEALAGQIFLVVLVARLVTLYTPRHGLRAELREREAGAATTGQPGAPHAATGTTE
jgi:hypothetical protein